MQTVAAVTAVLTRACRWGVSGISRRRFATCALHPALFQLLLVCCAACCCPGVLHVPCAAAAQVAARVLDVLLQSNSDAILLRMGLAFMEALSSKLLELHDFEEIITYLKVGLKTSEMYTETCNRRHMFYSAAHACVLLR